MNPVCIQVKGKSQVEMVTVSVNPDSIKNSVRRSQCYYEEYIESLPRDITCEETNTTKFRVLPELQFSVMLVCFRSVASGPIQENTHRSDPVLLCRPETQLSTCIQEPHD